jgi:hypothetical protein
MESERGATPDRAFTSRTKQELLGPRTMPPESSSPWRRPKPALAATSDYPARATTYGWRPARLPKFLPFQSGSNPSYSVPLAHHRGLIRIVFVYVAGEPLHVCDLLAPPIRESELFRLFLGCQDRRGARHNGGAERDPPSSLLVVLVVKR